MYIHDMKFSLVPRPFEEEKGLVHTVRACAKFTEHFLVKFAGYCRYHAVYGVVLVSKIKFDMHSNMLCKAIGKMWNHSASCADSANLSASCADSANRFVF